MQLKLTEWKKRYANHIHDRNFLCKKLQELYTHKKNQKSKLALQLYRQMSEKGDNVH